LQFEGEVRREPRGINVALSRARCVAILVASPRLLDVACRTPAQIELVNTLCWVQEYSRGQD
jgi:uncharacterized protein